ncbi:MAG: hypothetical protein ENTB_05227 [Enterocloster aldenensis]
MVVEIDRQGDVSFQEGSPEMSDTAIENLVDIEVVIEFLLRAVTAMRRIQRAEIIIRLTRALGIIIVVNADVISVIFNLVI